MSTTSPDLPESLEPCASEIAPAVDWELLRTLVAKQLPRENARLVYRLIHSDAHWDEAHTQVLVEHARQSLNR